MKNALRLISAGALLAAGLPLTAAAQTITVNATVASQCSIGTATVNLGALNLAVQTNNTGSNITLTCNRSATVTVALNDGANGLAGTKRMQRGATGDFISYNITRPTISGTTTSCPALPGTEWNATNTLVASTMFSAAGGPVNLALCVSVPSGQFNVGAGAYVDTVTATVTVT